MQTLEFDSTKPFNDLAKRALRAAVVEVFGHAKVRMEYAKGAALHFGVTAPSVRDITLSENEARTHRELVAAIRACLPRIPCTPWLGSVPDKLVLYLDIETHEADKRWDMPLNEFFRLGQYAWGPTGDVHLTDDIFHLMQQIERARGIIAHNGHAFDFSVLLGDAALADERLFDTMVFANQAFAAPHMFTKRDGSTVITDKTPMNVAAWLGLDNLAFQLELEGKEGDLKALAKEFGGFGLIPTDDPRFRAYAEQDIRTLQLLTTELVTIHAPTPYDWGEQRKAAINAQMARNGVRIDVAGAHERIAELTERKETLLTDLHTNYGFPTTGKMPWRTKAGKRAILNILASFDITPENTDPEVWPMLKTGPSLGGKVLLDITEGTKAEDVGLVLAELQGQRWLAQTALDNIYADGLCHPDFTAWQRSGRVSVRNPGLTIWGERNPRDKAYIIAKPGNVLLEADFSNADQRVVAALSGDPEYAKRFLPGADGHEITGRLVYGDAVYDSDPKTYRTTAKNCIAQGQLVLTDHGEIPIEEVSTCMLLWDGEAWVSHAGVIDQGIQEVLTYEGITATPDHIVFTNEYGVPVEISFRDAASLGSCLVTTGSGGRAIRVSKDNQPGKKIQPQKESFLRRGSVHSMWKKWLGDLGKCNSWFVKRLPHMPKGRNLSVSVLVAQASLRCKTKMRKPEKARVSELRSTRNKVQLPVCSRCGHVLVRDVQPVGSENDHRTNRYERELRSREHHNGISKEQFSQQKEYRFKRIRSRLLALYSNRCYSETVSRDDKGRDYSTRTEGSKKQVQKLAGNPTTSRVYDIYLAGPRNRFTVQGKLVHNCSHAWSYGCGPTKLAKTAKTDYDTALRFVKAMQRAYPVLTAWQNRVREEAKKGFIVNYFGRRVHIDRGMEYTQAPAMHGQSMTTEILYRGLIRLFAAHPDMARYLICVVHDAVLFDLPPERVESAKLDIRKSMETTLNGIHFPVSFGNPAINWQDARHV